MSTETPAPLPEVPAWLDEVEGEQALAWVEERNDITRASYETDPVFEEIRSRTEAILDSADRIPAVGAAADRLYNLWTDAEHPRGLWRRTTWESYRHGAPGAGGQTTWETLLDLDALGEAEATTWVWHGSRVLRTGPLAGRRALVTLSDGGSDTDITREFDLDTREFLSPEAGGFHRGPSKGSLAWADDEGSRVLCSTDLGEGSLTSSGYPRVVQRLDREGQAETLLVAPTSAVAAWARRDSWGRTWIGYMPDFYTEETWLLPDDAATMGPEALTDSDPEELVLPAGARHVDVPASAGTGSFQEWLTIELREDWTLGSTTYLAGSLLAAPLEDYLAGSRELSVLFEPTRSTSLVGATSTRSHLVLTLMDDVVNRLEVLTPPAKTGGSWSSTSLDLSALAPQSTIQAADDGTLLRPGRPLVSVQASAVDPRQEERLWLTTESFTSPTTLAVGELTSDGNLAQVEVLRTAPAHFTADDVVVSQHVAVSKDGTRIPYFQMGRPGEGPRPTLVFGYGGFEIPLGVGYQAVTGAAWLERGGVYVRANLRGGGEYGPDWHRAGLKENRHRVYEDMAAVVSSLAERGVARSTQIAVHGGSNGGLLVGNMLTQYPELIGAVVCEVPLLDMKRYTHMLAGASWAAEYGDPDDPAQWEFIKTFSPFHLLEPGRHYPPVFFVTSTRDDRVHPAHARTMAYRMLAMGQDVTYFENSEGGHGRASTNAQRALMSALIYTFAWRVLEAA